MKIINSIVQMRKFCARLKKNKNLALVPTMGFLHAGHLKLIDVARRRADVVAVSIFVNPLQFGKNEDLGRYPRDVKGDIEKLKNAGVDLVFLPTVREMYPEGFQTAVHIGEMSQGLCGASRPGHFDGVATVVLKLFNIVCPDVAVFGKKDYQQLQIIKVMVRDFSLPIRIMGVDIVRAPDGLALSSRNSYLSMADRELALGISRGLKSVRMACLNRTLSAAQIKARFMAQIPRSERVVVDYVECRDSVTLQPLTQYRPGKTLLAAAVFVGGTRLIDNIVF